MKRYSNLTYLWATNWWDGPLAGMIWYRGFLRWFDCYEENPERDGGWYRRYRVQKLALWQIAFECLRHVIFVLWVKKIQYGWRGFYRLFPTNTFRYQGAPILGIVEVK